MKDLSDDELAEILFNALKPVHKEFNLLEAARTCKGFVFKYEDVENGDTLISRINYEELGWAASLNKDNFAIDADE